MSVRSVLENAWLYAGRLPVGRERGYGYSQLYDGAHEALIGVGLAERVAEWRGGEGGTSATVPGAIPRPGRGLGR